jgi:hypothetical protein
MRQILKHYFENIYLLFHPEDGGDIFLRTGKSSGVYCDTVKNISHFIAQREPRTENVWMLVYLTTFSQLYWVISISSNESIFVQSVRGRCVKISSIKYTEKTNNMKINIKVKLPPVLTYALRHEEE